MVDIQAKLKEIGPFVEGPDDNLLVCRCEEVTKDLWKISKRNHCK